MTTDILQQVKIPYRDLSVKNSLLKKELLAAVEQVLSHGRILLGPETEQFEKEVSLYCGRRYAVGVGSGTAALYLALQSLGVGPGDEVITTPMSWIATVNAIIKCGAEPVFVDIGEDLNINSELIEESITPRTKVILPVHYTGRLCDIEKIMMLGTKHNIAVVEDAAQAFGARVNNKPAGAFGLLACFSMNAMKVFCGYGEAGAVVTDDERLSEKLQSLRYAGTVNKEDCHYPSLNGRIDTIQAAMLLVSLKYLQDKIERRQKIARLYSEMLDEIVVCPKEKESYDHTYYTYTILAERRDDLKKYLAECGVETKVHHPILMPYHTAYRGRFKPNIPVAEKLVQKILSIPNQEDLSEEQIIYITKCIRKFYAGN